MGAASAVSGGLGIVNGISGLIQGAKEQREAKAALDAYQRQELKNVAEGLQVSTLGSDLQREEQARLASSQVEALRDSGTRGLIGGLGRVEAGNQAVMAKTGADLDMQQKQLDQMKAEDDARIRSMQENREQNDINALSSQYQAGKNDKNMAMGNIIQGVGMFGGLARGAGSQATNELTSGFSTSGTGIDLVNNNYQMPTSAQNYQDQPSGFNFPTYQQPNQNVQQPYGFFNRYPYTPTYGPQNR